MPDPITDTQVLRPNEVATDRPLHVDAALTFIDAGHRRRAGRERRRAARHHRRAGRPAGPGRARRRRAGGGRGDPARPPAARGLRDRPRRRDHRAVAAAVKRAVAGAGRVAVAADRSKLAAAAPLAVMDLAACDFLCLEAGLPSDLRNRLAARGPAIIDVECRP